METKDNGSGVAEESGGAVSPSAAALFALVWNAMAGTLGTAAAAVIVRRAAGRAAATYPELGELLVLRENFEYRYQLPAAWSATGETAAERHSGARRALFSEIGRLLVELTGTVVIDRLDEIPDLRGSGIAWRSGEAN